MNTSRTWMNDLRRSLPIQAGLLDRLVATVENDSRWEWLELGCSVAAGRGDVLSDLDLALGYVGGEPPPVADVTDMLKGLGETIDVSAHQWNSVPRWWIQYVDGGQIDMVVLSAQSRTGRAPGSIALLDRSGRLKSIFIPSVLKSAAGEPREWFMDGLEALGNVAKYLHRGSTLEGIDQLHRARGRIYQLWAVGEDVAYPVYGLTSLVDESSVSLPRGIEDTYAIAEPAALLSAAITATKLLSHAATHADPDLESPLLHYVTQRLQCVILGGL